MRLLNTMNRLPGGWRYQQLDAGGRLLHKWDQDFDPFAMFLEKVLNFRKANNLPRADIDSVDADVQEYLAREFGGDPRYFDMGAQKKTSVTPRYQRQHLAKLVDTSRAAYTGAQILKDWLGDGLKPVSREEAQNRADVCTGRLSGNPCAHNNSGHKFTETVAQLLRAWSEEKNKMTLSIDGEDNLKSCNVCLCHLPTKVWVPMETILGRTPKAMLDKFASVAPENCWMRKI